MQHKVANYRMATLMRAVTMLMRWLGLQKTVITRSLM